MTTWVGYGLLHLAQQKGFFKDQGVDVSLMTVQDKPSTAAAIATGPPRWMGNDGRHLHLL
ncbi:ABC transporter substrate-binding protein [Sinorhizobium meliloti]|uniref:ABC transporter substrate-binding protein n=1 Tax=Rhizobium meliloti TaxID=382 RepID=UPI0039082A8C